MAHARSPHPSLLALVGCLAALCARPIASSREAQDRRPDVQLSVEASSKRSLEAKVDEKYRYYLELLDGYRGYDEPAARLLGSFWERLQTIDHELLSPFLARIPIGLMPISQMSVMDIALDRFVLDNRGLANRHLLFIEKWIDDFFEKNDKISNDPAVARERRFARDWYLATIWLRIARAEAEPASRLLDRARTRFPNDPDVLLTSGTYEELELARINVEHRRDRRAERGGKEPIDQVMREKRAITYFESAIALDANAAEARLRLAFLLMSMGSAQFDHALTLLRESRQIDAKPPLSYLAALFAGDIEERRRQFDAAATWYRTAISECPRAQTARVAYSHLQLDQNASFQSAQNSLRPLIGGPPNDDGICEPDPWRQYDLGQSWRLNDKIGTMRRWVREPVERTSP